jgi:16S rRNA (cytosine967-C5)-methyltransferase
MGDRGRVIATEAGQRRLAPLRARLQRAGAKSVEIRTPRGRGDEPLAGLEGKADLVLVDAPCTGTGTWRRNPDAKWRIRPGSLEQRLKDQDAVLDRAGRFAKAEGRIAYITCSLLPQENDGRVAAFRERHAGWHILPPDEVAGAASPELVSLAAYRSRGGAGFLLTPARLGTDGFFLAVLRRSR